jgi:two-component system sensor histidine kinase BaeS
LSRSLPLSRPLSVWQPLVAAALALTLAIGVGLLLTQLLMAPPADDLKALAGYLSISGAATMAAGWIGLQLADRAVGLPIRAKAFVGTAIGTGVALLNVVIVAQLMFVSMSHDFKLLIALIVFSAVVTLFFSLWVAGTVARRLETVAVGIRSLAHGDYATRVEVAGGDEVSQLAEHVNELAARLEAAEEERSALDRERKELTTAISHDLRTPLASVQAMIEALDDGVVGDSAEVRRYYATIRREVARLSRMIDDLFELARMDAGALKLELHPVSLEEVAAEVVDAMQAQAQQRGVELSLQVDDGQREISLDGARMERVASNLVRNALEHTSSGGKIDVSVTHDNGWASLRVADNGVGIESEALPRIWDRFYRAERSRQRAEGSENGAGLGLAIVRGFVEAHGGTVEAASSPGEGTTFTVKLPADNG